MPAIFVQTPVQPPTRPAWQPHTAYVGGTATAPPNTVHNGDNSYMCKVGGISATSGGPTGTGSADIIDGGVTWLYCGPAVLKVYEAQNSGQVDDMALCFFENPTPDPPISATTVTILAPQQVTVFQNGNVYKKGIFQIANSVIYTKLLAQYG